MPGGAPPQLVCRDLDVVMEAIARERIRHPGGDCIEVVLIQPVDHVIRYREGNETRVISQNVVFRGVSGQVGACGELAELFLCMG